MSDIVMIWIGGGLLTLFLAGFNRPMKRMAPAPFIDWSTLIVWPIQLPSEVASFGAAVRRGWKD